MASGSSRGRQDQGSGAGNYQTYPNSGGLFPNQKQNERAPDLRGRITIAKEVLDYIVQNAGKGEVTIELSAWRKMSRQNNAYFSVGCQVPYQERQGNQMMRPEPRRYDQSPMQQQGRQNVMDFDRGRQRGGYAQQSGRDAQPRADERSMVNSRDPQWQKSQPWNSDYDDLNDEIPF